MHALTLLYRTFYWPICRAYARYLGDKQADALLRCLCIPQFWTVHRYWPNFVHPKSFNEKLWSRMLHDRDPRLTMVNNKLQVRDYVSKKVGEKYLVPLLWQGEHPEEIPFAELPEKFVIKSNHGSGDIKIVTDKKTVNPLKIRRQLKKWLNTNLGRDSYLGISWGYKNIHPSIMIESFIEENGKAPIDYKFYCFSGHVEFLTLHYNRFEQHKTISLNRNFEPYDFRYDFDIWEGECQRPPHFDVMVNLAETLSEDFDFIRVDLYSVKNNLYFSELTTYPGGINTRFLPLSRDYILGEKWCDFKIYTLK